MSIPRTKVQAEAEVKAFTRAKHRTLKALATGDSLDAERFLEGNPPAHLSILVTYRCPNRHAVEIPIPSGPIYCETCGLRMRPAL